MLNRISLLTAVCLTASAGLFVSQGLGADDMANVGNNPAAMTNVEVKLPAGITPKNLNEDKSIDKAFKAVTEDALSKNGFDNLVSKLVDQDRDRIKKSVASGKSLTDMDGNNNKRLTDLVADLNGSFKSKYNHAFDIDISKVYTKDFTNFMTGEVSDPQLLVGKWPVEAMPKSNISGEAGKVTQSDVNQAQNHSFGGDVNLEKGRDVAIAHILPSHGMSGLTASLIHENVVGWKFDVPNNLTAEKLYGNLINNLSYLDQHKDQWPSDVNDAYRQFSHATVAALYDINISSKPGTAAGPLSPASPRPTEATNR